ncbi:MAG: hypothetical protein JWM86_898 [Thermoleophilia bacterium]|nr:hypothetical protein [Thermoleophilia bacterium]
MRVGAPASIALAPVPTPSTVPSTETAGALQAMTPRSRALLPAALLDAKVGRGTLAGALNDQLRFRVEQRGSSVADWEIVPDSPLAGAIAQTAAGGRLLRQLRAAMESTGTLGRHSNLKGFILPDDLEGVIAARAVAFLEDPAEPEGRRLAALGAAGDTREAGRLLQSWREPMAARAQRAGAWNGEGWITFLPHTARAMLVASGAYDPHASREAYLRKAADRVAFLAGNGAHEVQHSVTDRTPSATFTWMEEGIANVFSRTPVIQAQLARDAGLSPHRYAGLLAHPPSFDTGWTPYARPANAPGAGGAAHERERERTYERSQVVLRDLARLAGADFRSSEGRARAYDLLQGRTLRYVPGRLADAIIERHGLDPRVRERLRARVTHAVDLPRGAADIAREFGIT